MPVQIAEWLLSSLLELSSHFEVKPLVKCCEEIIDCWEVDKKLSESGKILKLSSSGFQDHKFDSFPLKAPVDVQKIGQFLANGKHSDINIHVNGHGLVAKGHKLILSLWSVPLAKVHSFSFFNYCVIFKIWSH